MQYQQSIMLRCRIDIGYLIDINNPIDFTIDRSYSATSFTPRRPAMSLDTFWTEAMEHLAALALAS